MSLWSRIVGVFYAEDEALNAAGGGRPTETLSGTIGRACGYGGGTARWWGPPCRFAVELLPWFGAGHCQRAAEAEAKRREAEQGA